jgi:TPR repeat protein
MDPRRRPCPKGFHPAEHPQDLSSAQFYFTSALQVKEGSKEGLASMDNLLSNALVRCKDDEKELKGKVLFFTARCGWYGLYGLLERDSSHILRQLQEAAELGNGRAQLSYGLYLKREGEEEEAREYVTKGMSSDALCEALGLLHGYGGEQNQERALQLLREIAEEKGDDVAQYYVGLCYAKGLGEEKSTSQAMHWLEQSAKQGSEQAQRELGLCYLEQHEKDNQVEGSKSKQRALEWLRKASRRGDARAENVLRDIGASTYKGKARNSFKDDWFWC